MADTSATIIAASLNSDDLEKSINKLVETVATKTKAMADNFTSEIARMEQAVRNLGNVKVNSSSSADGGSSRRTSTLKREEEQTKNVVAGYDAIAAANSRAAQSASTFIQNEREQLRMRQHEIEARLKEIQSKYGNVEVRAIVRDDGTFGHAIDNIKQKIQEARQKLQEVPPTSALGRQFSQELQTARVEYNELLKSRKAFESQSQIASLTAEYQQNNQKIKELASAYAHATTGEKQLESSINSGASAIERYGNSAEKAYQKMMKLSFDRAINIPTKDADLAAAKLERLQSILADHRFLGALSPSQIARARKEVDNLEQALNTITTKQEHTTQSAHQYTEEIRRQAQAIRESVQWQEKGYAIVNGVNVYNLEKDTTPLKSRISLEEQLLQLHKSEEASMMQQAAGEEKVAQATRLTEEELNRVYQGQKKVNEEISKRASGIRAGGTTPFQSYDSLRQSIAAVLGVQEQQIKMADTESGSYNQLSSTLKQLKQAYDALGRSDRNSDQGRSLVASIHEVERAMQKIRSQAARPVSLESIIGINRNGGLSEKTLDDIAYKMQRLASYRSGLDVSTNRKEIREINSEYDRLKKKMDEVLEKNQQMISSNNALGRSWNYMKNRLAFYFTVGASTQFIRNLIEIRSQYEMNERALGILVNSAERGTQIFNELSQMALVSPYTLIELSAAAKQLTAYDVAAKDVVDTTRRLADMAAAVGIPIERLTYALGQIKAYGYLNARDARMFANAGIPLVKQLSEYYTELEGRLVSTADIYDRIKKKSIGYEEVTNVIARMTDEGGKFYDFQAKMAETLKVQLANLTLAWNNMLNAMGEESQGVLVGGINALKQMFLHWKDIEHVLYELVIALGAYKAYQIITTRLMGATSTALDSQILAMKRNNAAMLEKQALTKKLTVEEARLIATKKQVTAADYMNALSGKQLTKQKALMLVAFNKNNVALKSAIVNMGLLTTAEVNSITKGKALAIVLKSIGISIRTAALAIKSFVVSMLPLLAIGAIYELYHAWDSYGEHVKEVNKQAAENAKEAFQNIKEYLQSDVTSALQDKLAKGGKVENEATGQKSWDEMREKIELSSIASNAFIAKLMQINDISQRLSAGFKYLESIQKVAGVMQTLEEDAIKVSSTSLGGLFGEGLKDDLNDFITNYEKYISLTENLRQSSAGEEYFKKLKTSFGELTSEIQETTESLYNVASREGFNMDEQREFFEREISEIAQAEQMSAKETRIFRMRAEREYYTYARTQLVEQLEYQQGAQKAATENKIKELDNEFGRSKAIQESFFTWLAERQDHAVKNMLRDKTQEEIKQGEWLKGANAKWVEEMARKFSKEYGVSFDDLHRLVLNANTWSINIPVFFQTIAKQLSDAQKDYESRTGKRFSENPDIKDAKTQVEILDILKKKQKEVANEMATAEKAGGQYWENNKKRLQEQNDALVSDIHAYNALTDAEEKAQKKGGSKGSKKDALLDALKQEISLVEKLQNDYDNLSKGGASKSDALDTIFGAYGKTIKLLNAQLKGYGLPQIDISQLITGKDPNKTLEHFKKTLGTLVDKGLLTLERSKELETVIEKLNVSAKTYNLDKITKGLNNELDRLKEEYELAVALDADPELGSMFASYMGINLEDLPKTAEEAAKKAQEYIDKILAENNSSEKIDISSLMDKKAFDSWVESSGHDLEDGLVKAVSAFRSYLHEVNVDETKNQAQEWNKLLEKYAEYEYKVTHIQKEAEREREIARKKGASQDVFDAINNRERQEIARVGFEKFQKSPEWIAATGDLANMSKSAIGMLIEELERYKRTAKNLSPKEIKQLNNALSKLYKEQRKNNPFKAVVNMLDEAKERMSIFDEEIEETQKQIDELSKKNKTNLIDGIADDDTQKKLKEAKERLGKLKEERDNIGKIDASTWVSSINETISAVKSAIDVFDGLAKAIDGVENSDVDKVFSILDSAGKGASTGAAFGPYGAIIGGVVGAAAGVVNAFADVWSGNESINKSIEVSTQKVRTLEREYKRLERAVDDAYGTDAIGAQRLMMLNKEAELAELERQLELEKSRKAKNQDQEKINELRDKVEELRYEVDNAAREIILDLLEIGDAQDWANDFVKGMIDAFREGENYMKSYEDAFREMVDNLIAKTIAGKVIGARIEQMVANIKEIAKTRAESDPDVVAAKKALEKEELGRDTLYAFREGGEYVPESAFDIANERIKKAQQIYDEIYTKAVQPTPEDVKGIRDSISSWKDDVKNEFDTYMEAFGVEFGSAKDSQQLSALQQGIQSVSETTASALEGYMNGVSQQVYYHSTLLEQIRDAIIGADSDIQLGVQGQMLLQLQQSFQVQMAIQTILEGWSSPNGMAVRVQLDS